MSRTRDEALTSLASIDKLLPGDTNKSEHHRHLKEKKAMSRVRRNVVVQGRNFWTLFDTGSRNTYVVPEVASLLPTFDMPRVESVALGGRSHRVERLCVLFCLVEGLEVHLHARVLQEIGSDEEGRRIEILFGALAMEEWGLAPIPQENRIDTTHYPREFVEFTEERPSRLFIPQTQEEVK